jgi:DNA-binding NarL/FixJ family response regulator
VIRLIVADDQALVRAGLRMILEAQDDLEVVAEAADGAEAVAAAAQHRPDVVLMDVRMPGVDGLEGIRRLLAGGSTARVLVLTTFDVDAYVYEAMRLGASGFLLKDAPPAALCDAIRAVAVGETLVAPTVVRRLVERFVTAPLPGAEDRRLARLTEREREVLSLVGRGLSNAEIAGRLYLSEATVKTHVGRVLTKTGQRDRAQAVVLAYETGLVQPGSPG